MRANENMSPYTFKKVMESKCFWYGEAFAYIDRSGPLMRLIPLPDAHQMYEDEQGGRWYSFTAETKELDLTRKFHEDELLHLRFETGNGRYGIGILQMARDAIRTDLLSQKYAAKFYKQGARPSGIIEVPTKLDQANKDKVRASFERMVDVYKRQGKVRRENIGSIETAKRLVDTMIKYGYWPDKTTIGTSNSAKGKGEQAMAKEGDLIRRSELRRQLVIWSEKLRAAGECGGCEVELLRAVIRMVDAQEAVDVSRE